MRKRELRFQLHAALIELFLFRTRTLGLENLNNPYPFFVFQDKATGNKAALWLRSKAQSKLFQVGRFSQRNAGLVLFAGVIALAVLAFAGLKYAKMESKLEKIWVEGKIVCLWNQNCMSICCF